MDMIDFKLRVLDSLVAMMAPSLSQAYLFEKKNLNFSEKVL